MSAKGNSVCPAAYNNDGCTCRIDATSFYKATYLRGLGAVPTSACSAGLQMDGGLCYPPCETGYAGAGPVCWLSTASFDSLTAEACSALYDETLSGAARLSGKTKTIGFGLGASVSRG